MIRRSHSTYQGVTSVVASVVLLSVVVSVLLSVVLNAVVIIPEVVGGAAVEVASAVVPPVVIIPALVDGAAVVVASVALGTVVVTTGAVVVGLSRKTCSSSRMAICSALWRFRALTHISVVWKRKQ